MSDPLEKKLATQSYKGVRDFFPEDMAILRYITNSWSKTAESFGYERYDASVLEPAELYKSKGAENAELVNEQTYTFFDRGNREVTLRPEMTPTVARLIAHRQRDLTFPVRWYSIPNLFRYERPQRGRLREHWQFNCDIFGVADCTADIEMIALAYQTLIDFGATPAMFEILINDRREMSALYAELGIIDSEIVTAITRLTDRKKKISKEEYYNSLKEILATDELVESVISLVESDSGTNPVVSGLHELGIQNVKLDRSLARGFDYYTGTVFEVVDLDPINNRSLLGGGRYDNLTSLFSEEVIAGVGFGMGDVTMRDFLESHRILPSQIAITAPTLVIIPAENENNLAGEKLAMHFRARGIKTAVDISNKKLGKKISDAAKVKVRYALVVGETELQSLNFTLKDLELNSTQNGSVEELLTYLISQI